MVLQNLSIQMLSFALNCSSRYTAKVRSSVTKSLRSASDAASLFGIEQF